MIGEGSPKRLARAAAKLAGALAAKMVAAEPAPLAAALAGAAEPHPFTFKASIWSAISSSSAG